MKPNIKDVIAFAKSQPFNWLRDEAGSRCGYLIKSEKRIDILENASKHNYGRLYYIEVDDSFFPELKPYIYYKVYVDKFHLDKEA